MSSRYRVIANHLTLTQLLENPRSIFERGLYNNTLRIIWLAITHK